jgi:rhodanese-related sulfurtransferase
MKKNDTVFGSWIAWMFWVLFLSLASSAHAQLSFLFKDQTWPDTKALIQTKFPNTPALSTAELAQLYETAKIADVLLIDVRDAEEFTQSHLRGAVSMPKQTALQKVMQLPKTTKIVVYCSVGYRSAQIVQDLLQLGYSETKNLDGSIFAWANEDRPIFSSIPPDEKPANTVHPFNRSWGKLLKPQYHQK